MCGGCNIYAESAGVSLILARYWWVARQGRHAVREAEQIAASSPQPAPHEDASAFVDPLPELKRLV